MDVVVVGAGVAGLRVAELLLRSERAATVVVLEGKAHVGGRVRTVYEDDGAVAYEAGPWRIPESHSRAREACAAHGIPLVPAATRAHVAPRMAPARTGLTTWGSNALAYGVRRAQRLDAQTGYLGETVSASGSAPYVTRDEHYFVAPDGLSELPRRMAAGVDVRHSTRVVDVERAAGGRYVVTTVRRDGRRFAREAHECDALFVCVPPRDAAEWTALRRHARGVLHRVRPEPLCHVYTRVRERARTLHRADDDDVLAQTVTSQYGNDWVQASYTSGTLARMWSHLRFQSWSDFCRLLAERLWAGARLRALGAPRVHFWETAYHAWRAAPQFCLREAVSQCVEANATHLPGVYFAGEAFSAHQAWIEGALQTAELAVARWEGVARGLPTRALAPHEVSVEGRIVDPAQFMPVHPGSAAALANHLGEDVDCFFEHNGHSPDAWNLLGSMQIAWLPPRR